MASSTENSVRKIYQTVIDEVIQNVREQFLDDGYDDQFLQELKSLWESKLNASRALNAETETARLPIAAAKNQTESTTSTTTSTTTTTTTTTTSQIDSATMAAFNALPQALVPNQLFTQNKSQHNSANVNIKPILNGQIDGVDDSDSDEDDQIEANISSPDDYDNDDDDVKHGNGDDDGLYEGKEDPDPLNSSDDVSELDPTELFDTDNVIVCQYDKITRIKNRWKFYLKDGVMNINGRDYLFSKANGDAEW